MRRLATLALGAGLAASVLTGVQARDMTAAEDADLRAAVERFNTAMGADDFDTLVEIVPPRILDFVSKQADVEVDVLRAAMIEQMAAATAAVEIEDFGMDLDAMQVLELPDGEPYALIPTMTRVSAADAGRIEVRSDTLALLDEGNWYLLRVSEAQQLAVLREVYPQFASVEFSEGTMEALD